MAHAWRAAAAALAHVAALAAWGCGAVEPAPGAPFPPQASPLAAPLPLQPLTPLPNGQTVSQRHEPRASLKTVDFALAGDAARVVYPHPTLEPGRRYPVLLFFHGSGQDQTQLTDKTRLADKAAQEGWLSASAMLTGRTHWASPGALQATDRLLQALVTRYQADPKRIYMVGFSMGGGTALLAATNPLGSPYRAAAVVSTQGFTDLEAMTRPEAGGGGYARPIQEAYGGALTPQQARAHSPLELAEKLRGIPVYLEHGDADTAVPASHSRRLAERLTALGQHPVLRIYPGKGHGEDTIDEAAIIAYLRNKALP